MPASTTSGHLPNDLSIAAILPCYNEEATVTKVVEDLRRELPTATIYVYDNNSSDRTAELAQQAGAIVRHEERRGKGNVIRRAFADIDADIYIMVDGDDTYDAKAAPTMIQKLLDGPYDHVLGVRSPTDAGAYRPGHSWGNSMFNRITSFIFGEKVTDMLSGYRAMSNRFVKSFPAVSKEFEIETELTVHYMNLRIPAAEVPVGFQDRPKGSESKLRTFHDGTKILHLLVNLLRHERPVLFHGVLGTVLILIGFLIGMPVLKQFMELGRVIWLPTAVLASTVVVLGCVFWILGLVLEGTTRNRNENARLVYLRYASPRQTV